MKLIWLFILFELFPQFICKRNKRRKTSASVLKSIFNYDFASLPSIGQLVIWQITENEESFRPQIYNRGNIQKFECNKTYLLFIQSWPKRVHTYYWVGSNVSLAAKKSAAKYALLQYLLIKECIECVTSILISREEEYIESESFHNTINFIEERNVTDNHTIHMHHQYVDINLPSRLPNLYIVRGQTTSRIKAVPLGTQWFINDACLLLETGYKIQELNQVNIYCGPNVNEKTILRARIVTDTLCSYYINNNEQITVVKENAFKAFVEVLENSDNYKLHEVDYSNDHLKDADEFVSDRDKNVSFYRIYENKMTRQAPPQDEVFSIFHYSRKIVNEYGSHLFDSASISGIFLYMHNKAGNDEKVSGLEMTEEYLHNNYSLASKPTRLRINEIHDIIHIHIDCGINLIDYPRRGLNVGEHW